jgi:hypothetical protein
MWLILIRIALRICKLSLIINNVQKIGFNCITMPTFISAQGILAEMPPQF